MGARSGELLCVTPTRFQIASLHLRWMEMLGEGFPVTYGPDVLIAGGHYDQQLIWAFWQPVSALVIPLLQFS
jgi:hypothetical protein